LDRKNQCPALIGTFIILNKFSIIYLLWFVASKYGGVEIEEVAKNHPESMIVHPIDIKKGLEDKDAIEIAKKLELGDVAE